MMELVKLTADYDLKPFDCGDADLNGFLKDNAKDFQNQRLGNTFIGLEGERIAAYFCLLNDKISRQEVAGNSWRKVKGIFPHAKHLGSYPAIKIGRFAVSSDYSKQGLGSEMMDIIKYILSHENSYSAFRFLTVDAYLSAIHFYEKNGFKQMVADDPNKHTRLMYFDMMGL